MAQESQQQELEAPVYTTSSVKQGEIEASAQQAFFSLRSLGPMPRKWWGLLLRWVFLSQLIQFKNSITNIVTNLI